jgi:hypothetical protein
MHKLKQKPPHMRLYLRVAGALRPVLRFPVSAARRVREQVEEEDRARLIAHFAALDSGASDASHHLIWRLPVRHPNGTAAEDPLEQLWRLPARQPDTPN